MKTLTIEFKWAFLFFLMSLVWMVLEKLAGLHSTHIDKHLIYTNFFAIPAIALYVLALRDKRQNFYQQEMTYWQGFRSGIVITLIIAALSPLTQWIISYVITPEYFPNVIRYALQTGYYKTAAEANAHFNYQNYAVQSVIGALGMGLVTTAIVAIFTRHRRVSNRTVPAG